MTQGAETLHSMIQGEDTLVKTNSKYKEDDCTDSNADAYFQDV